MSTIMFNTFVVPLSLEDTRLGVCTGLNKSIDNWLSMIKGREIERSQPTIGSAPTGHSIAGTEICRPVISVTVKAETD